MIVILSAVNHVAYAKRWKINPMPYVGNVTPVPTLKNMNPMPNAGKHDQARENKNPMRSTGNRCDAKRGKTPT